MNSEGPNKNPSLLSKRTHTYSHISFSRRSLYWKEKGNREQKTHVHGRGHLSTYPNKSRTPHTTLLEPLYNSFY